MKVLVPLDGSVFSECMLAPALALAGGGEIDLIRVLPDGEHPSRGKTHWQAAESYLERTRADLEERGVTVRWDLETGDPVERICAVAREREPDLIAMATHGTGDGPGVRGSVAEAVLKQSAVPLLLANPRSVPKTHAEFWRRVLVPLDGSELADGILPFVEDLAARLGSEVTVFDVHSKDAPVSLEAQIARLRGAGVTVRRHTAEGDPAEQIISAAKDADMVCMSTHGRTGVARWWYGSVAETVLRSCDRPLLVVRPAESD